MSEQFLMVSTSRKSFFRLCVALCLVLVLDGCFFKRAVYNVPEQPLPAAFSNAAPDKAATAPVRAEDKPLQKDAGVDDGGFTDWWRYFGNPELESLINRGLANNPDVRIATIRLAQAKVRADQAKGGLLPSLSLPALIARQAPGGSVGVVPTGSSGGAQNAIQASLKGEWRPDIWGEQSALADSANFQLWRAVFERDNVQRMMAASLAGSYVEYLALNDRLRLAKETEKIFNETLTTLARRVDLGDATLGDLEQQKAMIFGLRAAIPNLEQQREDALNSMAFTVGSVPGGLKLSDAGLDSLTLPQAVPGLPSALLLRRPDVRMMEAKLLAADADIDVARARILPPLDLSAQAGYSSNMLAPLFQPKIFFWSAIASLTTSIFDAGRRENEKKYSESMYEEMVETYVRTIYQAMREVEGALVAVRLADKRLGAQHEAALSARRAWEINTKVFSMGAADLMTLLESERNYHRYIDDYQRAQAEQFKGYVSLFQALGGGVKPSETTMGAGNHPKAPVSGLVLAPPSGNAPEYAPTFGGVDVQSGNQANLFWQIELPGLYHRATVGAAWRDLKARFPEMMEGRVLLPRLNGKIDDENGGHEAWYRLSIAQFNSEAEAEHYCAVLQENHERCRIVSSRPDAKPKNVAPNTAAGGRVPGVSPAAGNVPAEKMVATAMPAQAAAAVAGEVAAEPGKNLSAAAEDSDRSAYTIQLGVFSNLENARIASSVWKFRGYEVHVSETQAADGRNWYAVRTGVFQARQDGADVALQIRRKEEAAAILVPTTLDAKGRPAQVGGLAQDQVAVPEPPEAIPVVSPTLKVLKKAEKTPRPARQAFSVQLGAFSSAENAGVALDFWKARGVEAYVAPIRDQGGRSWFALRAGVFTVRGEASAQAVRLGKRENVAAMVVPVSLNTDGKPDTVDVPLPPRAEPEVPPEPVAAANPPPAAPRPQPPEAVPAKPRYTIQLGAFASIENAATSMSEWQARGYDPYVCEMDDAAGNLRFSVRTGEFFSKAHGMVMVRSILRQDNLRGVLVPAILDAKGGLKKIDVSPLLPKASGQQPFMDESLVRNVR